LALSERNMATAHLRARRALPPAIRLRREIPRHCGQPRGWGTPNGSATNFLLGETNAHSHALQGVPGPVGAARAVGFGELSGHGMIRAS